MNRFYKYHGLGNDYLVLDPKDCPELYSDRDIKIICHRNFGLGSDGILYGPLESESADFKLRIINPDASEAEKSGNGLRIFARYLYDQSRVSEDPFTVETMGGTVNCQVSKGGKEITVDMGSVSFHSEKIPVVGESREVLNEPIEAGGETLNYFAATIGNPHCVIPMDNLSASFAKNIGPYLESHSNFPNRTNVQFLKILDRNNIQIEIWERGAGYTLASGSSSSAAGAIAKKMGRVDSDITVHMPGGKIKLHIDDNFNVRMTGPATPVGVYHLVPESLIEDIPEVE